VVKKSKNFDTLRQRDWSKNNAVFILNMMRAEVYSNFEQVDQGYSTTKMFEHHDKDCLVGLTIDGKDWLAFNNQKSIQVKYKVRNAAKSLSRFLIKQGKLSLENYQHVIYKIFILNRGRASSNNLIKTEKGEFIFTKEGSDAFHGEPFYFQYFCGKKDKENFFVNFS